MKYDFETVVNRTGTGAYKWNHMLEVNPDVDPDIIPLSVADMELQNPPEIREGLKRYIDRTVMGYTDPTEEYLEAVCGWMKRRHGWDVEKKWIFQTPGVVFALYFAVRTLTEPGDGVIIMTPVYYPFYDAVRANGRRLEENPLIETEDSYEIDFDDLEKRAKKPDTKMLLLCSPHNPAGRVWTRRELERIGRICIDNQVLIVSDEIHFDMVMPGYQHTVFASVSEEFKQHSIICTAPSKTFNLAGLQTSNIIAANEELRSKLASAVEDCGVLNTNILGYEACRIAYTECEEWLEELLGLIVRNKEYIENFVRQHLPSVKVKRMEGTYLQFLDFRAYGLENGALEQMMTREAQLFFDEGCLFGNAGSGFERINLACPAWVIEKAMARLETVLRKHYPETVQ